MLTPCPECGVPEYITGEHDWLSNGDIVQKKDREHRLYFTESGNFDPMIRTIGEIMGLSIENIVLTTMRRAVRMYLEQLLPEGITEGVRKREMDLKTVDDVFRDVARVGGYGDYQFVGMRYEGDGEDFFTVSVKEPFSPPMNAASHAAAMEAILGYDHDVTYTETAPDTYEIRAFPSEHKKEFMGRFTIEPYHAVEGDIDLKRCATCGGPKALSGYTWDLDRGVIFSKYNQRRMSLLGPHELDPIFRELEAELGEEIPEVVVEAQSSVTRSGFYTLDDIRNKDVFRTQMALRGLGNLRELNIGAKGLSMRLDNAGLPLMVVGMMKGIFEASNNLESSHIEWEFSQAGDLEMEVTPKG
jgi:hypothetical protein